MAALSAAGYELDRFVFAGFPPTRFNDRNAWFDWIAHCPAVVVLFEAPHRIQRTLSDVSKYFGKQPIIVARELTKKFEEVLEGPPAELMEALSSPRGEFTIVIPAPTNLRSQPLRSEETQEIANIGRSTENKPSSKREVARQIARHLGLPVRDVYEALVKAQTRRI
jgi:16S rRNA (cytidine1402-2'-O)-methyltransferase